MAPSRRKGANKARAAAGRPKWKVGDLVLAKVKGFPAWPATVSEPQKWGYPADLKKVLVYFFGTQQIAFCNPADVEEFTEEKKVSLLGKRHGKGSDFVRALNEIIDCFEKLKKQDQITSDDITEETNVTNENNSDESLTKSVTDEAPIITVKQLSGAAANDLNSLTEAAVTEAAKDALHDEEMQLEEAISNSVFADARVYSTRSKTDAAQSRNIVGQRRISARKLRSSSRRNASRLQSLMLPSTNNTRSSRRLGDNALQDRSLRRSKRIMKSSDDSEGQDVNSPAFVSHDSVEENDSGIMTVDSDTHSSNDGSSVDSGCEPMGEGPFIENNEGETELSDRLDFQTNATIIKKKRKPNRKRHRNDIVLVAKLDEVISEAEELKTECISPSNNEKVAEKYGAKEDGDEHLPLVKRARVRMGRPSPPGDGEAREAEQMMEVPGNLAVRSSGRLNSKLDAPADGETPPIKEDQGTSFLLHASPARKPKYWETRKSFVDGEAALPPSKRLHRALEAMSANVAEDNQRASICSPAVDTHTNGCSASFAECSEQSMERKDVVELGSGQVEDHRNGDSHSSASGFCAGSNMEVPEDDGQTTAVESDCGKSCGSDNSNPEFGKDSFEHAEGADSKCLKLSPLDECPEKTDAEHQLVNPDSPNCGEKLSRLNSNEPCLIMTPDGCKIEPSELKEAANRSEPDVSLTNSDSIMVEEIAGSSLNIDKDTLIDNADGGGDEDTLTESADGGGDDDTLVGSADGGGDEDTLIDSADGRSDETHKTTHLCLSETNQNGPRSEFVEEAGVESLDSNVMPSATPVKVLTSGHCGFVSHSNSISDDHLEDRIVSVTRSSSHTTNGPGPVARASPPNSSICNISASDKNGFVRKRSPRSPDVEKAKVAGKSSSKVEILSSFEATIRSLTRTKDNIGRATRVAIDCAKCGFATKVVEILARNLESESSPHKKVDLFFLVDSITQCSGGMKGDAGMYPSAIQALLPRLLLAAAPPGTSFYENHKQCLKVLRVWLERKILPESVIRYHIRELDALYGSHLMGGSSRSLRLERPFDDPIREMEGMLVDEYGSNSSIQLPGFCMPPMLKDDDIGSESDEERFEAVTPEHNVEKLDGETNLVTAVEKRSHILEHVDGELEMEDVAPTCEVEISSTSNISGTDCKQMSQHQSDNHYGLPFGPQQPRSPRPPPPPPPPPHPLPHSAFPPAVLDSVSNGPDPKLYPSSQEPIVKQSLLPRVKPRTLNAVHHLAHDNKHSEGHVPRQAPDCGNACHFSDQPTSHLSSRASNGFQHVDDTFSKGFHLRPPHPAPSNQFSYVREQRIQSRRDVPPPSHPNRYHTRNAENGNFYRERDRNKFASRDNIGEYWRPPLPSISGPCYHNGSRMTHAPMSYNGPPREPELPNNRWNYHPRSMNRQFNHYRPHSEGPIPVANRGPSSLSVLISGNLNKFSEAADIKLVKISLDCEAPLKKSSYG
ncbi:protein HUA2-LIKE 3 [Sesamum alatum]|uniref:Protein HUA2-LIKE 3 n=1 Tax=Sesamum alatum TaxID=300844 RepID=A0AAE2D0Z4_9LAMI|nr:protein HUA2-LIKE 3 [Sesamum alatum]